MITRDWAGGMMDALEAESGMISTFFAGPSGDTGPRLSNGLTTGNIKLMEKLGEIAGNDAVSAFKSIKDFSVPKLRVITDYVHLSYEPLMPRADAKKELDSLLEKATFDDLLGSDKKAAKKYMDAISHYDMGLPDKEEMVYPLTAVAIGEIAFFPFPFEVFGEIALRIAQLSPFAKTLVLNNTNGSHAYFPTKSEIPLGGYEVFMFRMFQTYTPVTYSDSVAVTEYIRILNLLQET